MKYIYLCMIIIIILTIIICIYNNFYSNDYINKITNFKTFIYPIAWEDPKIDSKYLKISEKDNILMITTGGCNILNTLLLKPNRIVSCDLSPAQNALLDIKLAAIKTLDYEDFWKLFGLGKHKNFDNIYNNVLKKELKLYSSIDFWNRNKKILSKKGLYNCGKMNEGVNFFKLFMKKKLEKLCNISNKKIQYDYYINNVKPLLFNKMTKPFLKKILLEFAGVPKSQMRIITHGTLNSNKIYKFIENSYDFAAKKWSIRDENYFFYGLMMGYFRKDNCPDYLKEENYNFLKKNIEKINIFNGTLNDYMNNHSLKFDKFILLDHMDWYENKSQLNDIFDLMIKKSNKNAYGLFRSGNSKSWITEHIGKYKNINLIDLCDEYENDRLATYPGFFKFEIQKQ